MVSLFDIPSDDLANEVVVVVIIFVSVVIIEIVDGDEIFDPILVDDEFLSNVEADVETEEIVI